MNIIIQETLQYPVLYNNKLFISFVEINLNTIKDIQELSNELRQERVLFILSGDHQVNKPITIFLGKGSAIISTSQSLDNIIDLSIFAQHNIIQNLKFKNLNAHFTISNDQDHLRKPFILMNDNSSIENIKFTSSNNKLLISSMMSENISIENIIAPNQTIEIYNCSKISLNSIDASIKIINTFDKDSSMQNCTEIILENITNLNLHNIQDFYYHDSKIDNISYYSNHPINTNTLYICDGTITLEESYNQNNNIFISGGQAKKINIELKYNNCPIIIQYENLSSNIKIEHEFLFSNFTKLIFDNLTLQIHYNQDQEVIFDNRYFDNLFITNSHILIFRRYACGSKNEERFLTNHIAENLILINNNILFQNLDHWTICHFNTYDNWIQIKNTINNNTIISNTKQSIQLFPTQFFIEKFFVLSSYFNNTKVTINGYEFTIMIKDKLHKANIKDIKLNKNQLLLDVKNKKLYAVLYIKNESIKSFKDSIIFTIKPNAEIFPYMNFQIMITEFRIVRLKSKDLLA